MSNLCEYHVQEGVNGKARHKCVGLGGGKALYEDCAPACGSEEGRINRMTLCTIAGTNKKLGIEPLESSLNFLKEPGV